MTADDKDGIEELARAIDALFLAIRQARASAFGHDLLSISQQALLEPLVDEAGQPIGGLPVGVLASAAGVSVPTATRTLKQLEAKGVVTRTRAAQDERRVLIELTDLGLQRMSTLRGLRREAQMHGLAVFEPEERIELAAQLRRLTGMMKSRALH